jgi:kynurenine formamidase
MPLRAILPAVLVLLSTVACQAPLGAPAGRWIDLTHEFSPDTIYWPTSGDFELEVLSDGITANGYYYAANRFRTAEHGGTHLDAPVHFAQGQRSVEALPIEQLVGPAVVIDVSKRALADRDYRVTVEDLVGWELMHGRIPDGAIVLLRTGYGAFWPDRPRYLGTARRGEEALAELHFPGLHANAAQWLVTNRRIDAIGIDTASIDHGQSKQYESHRILAAEGVPVLENVASLERLPPTGVFVLALPMKIRGGSGGPVRIVAHLP